MKPIKNVVQTCCADGANGRAAKISGSKMPIWINEIEKVHRTAFDKNYPAAICKVLNPKIEYRSS